MDSPTQDLHAVRWAAMLNQRKPNLASLTTSIFDYDTVTDLEREVLRVTDPWRYMKVEGEDAR